MDENDEVPRLVDLEESSRNNKLIQEEFSKHFLSFEELL